MGRIVNHGVRYTPVAISLHWLIALLIFAGWGLGIYMSDLPLSPAKLRYYSWHKWMGVTTFMLVVLRAGWLATHPAPGLPRALPPWQARIARVTHFALYLLMFLIPLSGWLMSSAKGVPTVYFGVLPIPDLIGKNQVIGTVLDVVHSSLAFSLAALVGLHVAAALKHHFMDRDGLMGRMVPFLKLPRQ
jgi:cytochrome b561